MSLETILDCFAAFHRTAAVKAGVELDLFTAVAEGVAPAGYKHFWSIPGVVHNGSVGTMIACTNSSTTTASVGIEVFGPAGGAALNTFSPTSMASGTVVHSRPA